MNRADGVAKLAASVFAALFDGFDGGAQVADVVQSVENADDIHAALAHAADEGLHHVIGKTGVLDDILPAQEHDLRRFGRGLVEEAETGIDRRAAPGFQPVKAHLIEDGSGWEHLLGGHARGGHRLVSIAQDRVVEKYRFHILKP